MPDPLAHFKERSLVVILAYAPTGLGHLRVTEALYRGLPSDETPILLGSQDKTLGMIHRLMSTHPIGRTIMEWVQMGWQEDLFTYLYSKFLRSHTDLLYGQMVTIMDQRIDVPKTILVVSTHFGLSHQLAYIKEKLAKNKGVKIILVVVVTDDTPQHIWYTSGADLTFVPSFKTRNQLLEFARKVSSSEPKVKVVPYPVGPDLAEHLSTTKFSSRKDQLDMRLASPIHVSVPISGAAVGLHYTEELIKKISLLSPRFVFHVVAKMSKYTEAFLGRMQLQKNVHLYTSTHDREIVDKYEELYKDQVIAFEVTKPSEQAFKCLLKPTQRGGSILLFSHPVGKQEYDNIDFLRRHNLTSQINEQQFLWEKSRKKLVPKDLESARIWQDAEHWRAVRIPDDPQSAADFVWWGIEHGLFRQMLKCKVIPSRHDRHFQELGDDGVKQIWQEISHFLSKEK